MSEKFCITITDKFITLGQFLKFSKIINSGGLAKDFLTLNTVLVDGVEEKRRGRKLFNNTEIKVEERVFVVQTQGE